MLMVRVPVAWKRMFDSERTCGFGVCFEEANLCVEDLASLPTGATRPGAGTRIAKFFLRRENAVERDHAGAFLNVRAEFVRLRDS